MERVLLGMSGGVDSSCSAAILRQAGYSVEGATLVVSDQGFSAARDASAVAEQLGIPHHVIDVRERFRKAVIDPFVEAYQAGVTPNPCVLCNPDLKFAVLTEEADRLGCAKVATGHYASVRQHPATGRWSLVSSNSGHKDQSYFLYRLSQRQLSRVLFPLADLDKPDIRDLAAKFGLKTAAGEAMASKKDSQDICFLPDGDYRTFIEGHAGNIVSPEGEVIGTHQGLAGFTVGQRKGFEVKTTERLYVLSINPGQNTVTVGPYEQALRKNATLELPVYSGWENFPGSTRLQIRIRSSAARVWCLASSESSTSGNRIHIEFDEPVFAPAPGQSGVLYDGETVAAGGFFGRGRA